MRTDNERLTEVSGTQTLSRQSVHDDIAAMLGMPASELADDTNLLDAGLDSIRLMSLVQKWRDAGSAGADFVNLASEPVVGIWVDMVAGTDQPEQSDEHIPTSDGAEL
jgi:L-ornithine N5-oxygenase